jgi:hypothetical protein
MGHGRPYRPRKQKPARSKKAETPEDEVVNRLLSKWTFQGDDFEDSSEVDSDSDSNSD